MENLDYTIERRNLQGQAGKIAIVTYTPSTPIEDIIFVHGAWSSHWYWEEYFMPWLAKRGWRCRALSLRGHGLSEGDVRWASVQDYVDDVHLATTGLTNPIFVGHSMGGFIVQTYACRHKIRAMGLLASVPPNGAWPTFLKMLRHNPMGIFRTLFTLDLFGVVANPDQARYLLYSRSQNQHDKDEYLSKLGHESFRVFLDMLLLPIRNRLSTTMPIFVMGAEQDKIFGQKDIHQTAKFYRTEALLINQSSHMMMIDNQWEKSVELLLNWLESCR